MESQVLETWKILPIEKSQVQVQIKCIVISNLTGGISHYGNMNHIYVIGSVLKNKNPGVTLLVLIIQGKIFV